MPGPMLIALFCFVLILFGLVLIAVALTGLSAALRRCCRRQSALSVCVPVSPSEP